ncbi:MAG: FG-GAP repeat protein, partial [Chloroflexota bacterium]
MQRRLSIFLVLILSLTAMTVTVQAADTATLPQGQTTMAELPMDLQHTIFTSIHGDMASAPSASGTVPEQQAYLKPFNTERFDGFGFSVAVDGDTVVVGAYQEASAAGAAYVFTRDGDTWTQQAYLKADNAEVGDLFGYSVAVDDDTVVVGARFEDGSATTVNGPDDNAAEDAGAAYVFTRGGTTWSQQAYLKADNAGAGDWFGWSVAVDGDTVVVGARQEDGSATTVNGPDNDLAFRAGAAYVFTWGGGTWSQQAYLKADNTGNFGNSVAVDSDTVVVGAPGGSGAAYVFTWGGGTWSQQAYLKADNAEGGDQFGWSVAVDGDTAVMGAPSETSPVFGGAAYVFTRVGTTWSQQAYLKAANAGSRFSDNFGESVAVDGDTVVVGAPDEDGSATTVNGPDDNSARNAGAAYVFTRVGTTWSQQAYIKASNTGNSDQFGWSVAVDGDTAVVGARLEGGSATTVNGPDD